MKRIQQLMNGIRFANRWQTASGITVPVVAIWNRNEGEEGEAMTSLSLTESIWSGELTGLV